ncbi:MAG: ribonuclease E/G, partial [Stellaceae bacterium]
MGEADEVREWESWSPAPDAPWEAPAREPEAIALRAAEESLLAVDAAELAENEQYRTGETDGPAEAESVETFGGDEVEEVEEADAARRRAQPTRHYKIQEVVKRRQIMLVQVAKEERGNKGAALTTYLSLAGRYCVLMPNTGRGGGVSRKINSIADRRRLKDILEDLDIPEGMGVIVRTAGAERSKAEIKRDYEYLLRLWNEIRDLTLKSTAPALIYEEGNLIKRSIRDLYTRDIDEVLIEGEEGYKTAKAFMRTLMPSHAKRVQPYRDPQVALFHRFQIESQIDAIHSPVAQLRSGGYIVINQTEALVAIDVNSGRSTRERNIEETALRTNLEAADEIARQLRLRDLAGLIVLDLIDMEEHRNQLAVERRLKEALKNDRARIQVGRISPFGLLEMSRQRLRPSLAEASTQPCPHCGGTGLIRSVESTALYVLRSIEEEGIRRRAAEICVYVPTNVALYILNQKRESLTQIEARYGVRVMVAQDDSLIPPNFRLERLRAYGAGEAPPLRAIQAPILAEEEEEEEISEIAEAASEAVPEAESEE